MQLTHSIAHGGLDALPEGRREALLYRHALQLDYDGVDDLVREGCQQGSCKVRLTGDLEGDPTAVLGDDGRYHLSIDGQLLCHRSTSKRPSRRRRAYPHQQSCVWWTDGTCYRRQPPSIGVGNSRSRTARWRVHLLDQTRDPASIPPHGRCQVQEWDSLSHWPAYIDAATPIGRIRALLITELGPTCLACRRRPGIFVDHDHATNQVRGLLCHYCNTHADGCLHPAGCPWADYLNDPPAASLHLAYPNRGRHASQQKLDYFGFDMSPRQR